MLGNCIAISLQPVGKERRQSRFVLQILVVKIIKTFLEETE